MIEPYPQSVGARFGTPGDGNGARIQYILVHRPPRCRTSPARWLSVVLGDDPPLTIQEVNKDTV